MRYGWSSFAGWVRGVWVGEVWMEQFCLMGERSVGEEVWLEQFCWMGERSVGR